MFRRGFDLGSFCIVIMGLAGQANAQLLDFSLSGDQVRPERVMTDGSGECRVRLLEGPEFGMDLLCEHNLPDADGAHIREGQLGEVGPIVLSFEVSSRPCQDPQQNSCGSFGSANIKDDLAAKPGSPSPEEFRALLNSGRIYATVTTPTNPEGEIRGQFSPPYSKTFAQFGNGGGLTSDIVLLNTATTGEPTIASVVLLDPDGSPLDVGFEDSTGIASGPISVEPNSAVTLRTDGLGDALDGSAVVSSDRPLEGVIRFAIPGFGVAGVPAGPPLATGTAVVRNEGGIRTALAIRNTSGFDITVDCEASINGTTLAASFPVEFAGNRADFVDEIFPKLAGTEFNGIVTCSTDTSSIGTDNIFPQAGSFVAIVLEQGEGVFTTLPFF